MPLYAIPLGAVHKRRPQSGGLSSADKEGGGFFRCGRPHFLAQKTPDFSKLMVCSHGQGRRGLSQCGHFADKGEGSIFRNFVRTSFMDGLLFKTAIFLLRRGQKLELNASGFQNCLINQI